MMPSAEEKEAFVRLYFDRLTASEIPDIIDMFEPGAQVESPYLGVMPAAEFFTKLDAASRQNRLTVFDVLLGVHGNSAAAHFEYEWHLSGGDRVVFQGIDHFRFGATGKFSALSIFYDTYPTRDGVQDKYSRA